MFRRKANAISVRLKSLKHSPRRRYCEDSRLHRINSSILVVTAMSIDRFVAVVFPHFYRSKVQPKALVLCNIGIVAFSSAFASLQFANISMDLYLLIEQHLHAALLQQEG